jgi:hypothetical protein
MKLKDLLKEAISYKQSGLKNPNKADLNHDNEISSYEKKRGSAIEKSMKAEFKSQVPKKEGIKFGNEERPMETMPSLSREEMVAMNPMNNVCKECGAPMMYEDRMCSECGYMEEGEEDLYKKADIVDDDYVDDTTSGDGDASSLASSFIGGGSDSAANDAATDDSDSGDAGVSEGMDHEVSMAKSSLKNIISNASQLLNKLGDEEIDIPAWVQDHITNSDNYISQANDGYYEYESEDEPQHKDGVSLEDLMETNKKPSAGLSKTQKSAIVKKAKAGKDIGKKGSGFAAVEKSAKASGADNPKAVAAAAMWKGAAKRAHK